MSEPLGLFDERAIKNELRELVRQNVEDTLNGLLEEADDLVGAERYERTADREALWGASVSAVTVSNLNEKAFGSVEKWRSRPLTGAHPYAYVDSIHLKRAWDGACGSVSAMVVVGVSVGGFREAADAFPDGKSALMLVTAKLKYVADSEWGRDAIWT